MNETSSAPASKRVLGEYHFAGIRIVDKGDLFEVEINGVNTLTTEGVDVSFRKNRRPVVSVNFPVEWDQLAIESVQE